MAGKEAKDVTTNCIISVGAGFVVGLIAYVAQPHLILVFTVGIVACVAVLAGLSALRPRRSRPQLAVKIKGTPQWHDLNDRCRVVAAPVDVTNKMRRRHTRIRGYDFHYEGPDGTPGRVHLDGNEKAEFDNIVQGYYPQLTGFSAILPHTTISGWYVAPVPRNPLTGETPRCIITVKDGDENVYRATIPAHRPQVYSA
jgi:hypothetical protein